MSKASALKLSLALLILLVAFGSIARYAIINSNSLDFSEIHIDWLFLGMAFLFQILTWIFFSFSWKIIIREAGNLKIGFTEAWIVLLLPQFAAYMPFRIESLIGRVWILKKIELSNANILIAMFRFELTLVFCALSASICWIGYYGKKIEILNKLFPLIFSLILLTVILILLLKDRVPLKIKNWFELKFPGLNWNCFRSPYLWFYQVLGWLASACMFWSLAVSLGWPSDFSAWVYGVGAYFAAKTLGFIAFVVPSGLGVIELVLLASLSPMSPSHSAAPILVLIAVFRIWQIGMDLLGSFAAWNLYHFSFSRKTNIPS